MQNSKKIKSSLEFRIDYNFKETFFFSNLYFQAKSVPEPEQSETVTAAKATDVEGRLSALLQETKELKNEIKALSKERTAIKEQLGESNSTIAILQNEKNKLRGGHYRF